MDLLSRMTGVVSVVERETLETVNSTVALTTCNISGQVSIRSDTMTYGTMKTND